MPPKRRRRRVSSGISARHRPFHCAPSLAHGPFLGKLFLTAAAAMADLGVYHVCRDGLRDMYGVIHATLEKGSENRHGDRFARWMAT